MQGLGNGLSGEREPVRLFITRLHQSADGDNQPLGNDHHRLVGVTSYPRYYLAQRGKPLGHANLFHSLLISTISSVFPSFKRETIFPNSILQYTLIHSLINLFLTHSPSPCIWCRSSLSLKNG